jgi:hypothetical protein
MRKNEGLSKFVEGEMGRSEKVKWKGVFPSPSISH